MANVLESFLIGIGFQVDEKGVKNASSAFDTITKSALQLGSVIGSKLAIDKVVGDFQRAGAEMYNFNQITGTTAKSIDQLGFALQREGGKADDAFGFVKNLQTLMASPMTGNTGWMSEAARYGLDPKIILNAENSEEAILGLSDAFQKMNTQQRVRAGAALGFDDAQIRLLSKGRQELERYYGISQDIGNWSEEDAKKARLQAEAFQELDDVFEDIGRQIGTTLSPAITELVNEFTDFYKANRDLVNSGISGFFGVLADNLKLVALAMTAIGAGSALKGLAALRALLTLGGGAAAAGGGAAAAGGAAGASALAVGTGGLAALFYSSSLNSGEDEELRKMRQGEANPDMSGLMIKYFQSKGWSAEQAAGIVANLEQESGFNTDAEGDGGLAYGLAQWHPDRQANFAKWSGKDIRGSTLEDQLGFVNYELTEGAEQSAGGKLRGAKTAYDAGSIVSRFYERPANSEEEADMRGSRAGSYGNQVNDNRVYNITGADTGEVKRIINEQVGEMAAQSAEDFKSSER